MKTTIKPGDKIYLLRRDAHNVNNPKQLVTEMDIITGENGQPQAFAKEGVYTTRFYVTTELIEKSNEMAHPYLFDNVEDALDQYDKELEHRTQSILNQSKDELIKEFFQNWVREDILHSKIHNAMVQKIKTEFGVDVLQES